MNDTSQQALPPKILGNLKKYKNHVSIMCLECGYSGLMGVKSEKAKYLTAFGMATLITLIAAGFVSLSCLPMVWGGSFGVLSGLLVTKILSCPNCEKDLILK